MSNQALPVDESSGPQKTQGTSLSRALVIATLALAVGISLLAPGLALSWSRQPFLGVLLEHTLVVAGRPSAGWTGQEAGLYHPDRILSINGVPVPRSADLSDQLRRHQAGDIVTLEVEGLDDTGGWQTRQVQVRLMQFPLQDLVTRFLVAYIIGLLYLALGISGSEHHVRGIQDSGKIVAINRDPKAPIFQNSDVGLIADIRDVLPKLIERIRQAEGSDQAL